MKLGRSHSVILLIALFSGATLAQAPKTIPAAEATQHVGEVGPSAVMLHQADIFPRRVRNPHS